MFGCGWAVEGEVIIYKPKIIEYDIISSIMTIFMFIQHICCAYDMFLCRIQKVIFQKKL